MYLIITKNKTKTKLVEILGVLQKFETGSIKEIKSGCCTVSGDKVMQSINTKGATP